MQELVFDGVKYLIPEGNNSKYIVLPRGPKGSGVEVLNCKRHSSGEKYFSRMYVPQALSTLTIKRAVELFGPSVVVAQRLGPIRPK